MLPGERKALARQAADGRVEFEALDGSGIWIQAGSRVTASFTAFPLHEKFKESQQQPVEPGQVTVAGRTVDTAYRFTDGRVAYTTKNGREIFAASKVAATFTPLPAPAPPRKRVAYLVIGFPVEGRTPLFWGTEAYLFLPEAPGSTEAAGGGKEICLEYPEITVFEVTG